MADVKSSLFRHFDKLPELNWEKVSLLWESLCGDIQLCKHSLSIKHVFKKQPSHILFKKATNLIKAIRKSELTGNAHDSLYMLQYIFFFYFVLFGFFFFVCCSIVCLWMVRRDRPVFLPSTVAHHCWAEEEDSGGRVYVKSLSLLREKCVLLWANCEGRKCVWNGWTLERGWRTSGRSGHMFIYQALSEMGWPQILAGSETEREKCCSTTSQAENVYLHANVYAVTQLWLNDQSRAGQTSKAFVYI